ncbi:MAG: hypothetical protein KDK01_11080 [Rhodobacteraceae bacterium]|jgi:hypothetical protein|nr:hypothetical protein [Paracoccaceae bacterium]
MLGTPIAPFLATGTWLPQLASADVMSGVQTSSNVGGAGTDTVIIPDSMRDTAITRIQIDSDGLFPESDRHLDRIYAISYDGSNPTGQITASIASSLLLA